MTNTSPPNRDRVIDFLSATIGSIKKAAVSGGFLLRFDLLTPF